MSVFVKLTAIIDAMDEQSDERFAWLNKDTGKIVVVSEEDLKIAEDETEEEFMADWQREQVETAKEILNSDVYVQLPDRFEIDEYSLMEKFCREQPDESMREEIYFSLKGTGAFRHFKDKIEGLGIAERWYSFRDEAMKDASVEWCDLNDIEYME